MTEHAEVFRRFFERRELLEELFFGEFLHRETAFALVMGASLARQLQLPGDEQDRPRTLVICHFGLRPIDIQS